MNDCDCKDIDRRLIDYWLEAEEQRIGDILDQADDVRETLDEIRALL